MDKMTFTQESYNQWNKSEVTKVTVETNAVHIDDILLRFTDFLKGCGFQFEGHLEICQDEYIPEGVHPTESNCCGGCGE